MTTTAAPTNRRRIGELTAVAYLCAIAGGLAEAAPDADTGEYLAKAAGCVSCHTAEGAGAVPLTGGRRFETPFGTYFSPNITPDPETGIAGWTDDQFVYAVRRGMSPGDSHYYPAFPYPSYAGMTRDDVVSIKRYLDSVEPVAVETPEHELPWYLSLRFVVGVWKGLYATAEEYEPDTEKSETWNRGAYLVRHVAHCGECHTPRNRLGGLERDSDLQGNPDGAADEAAPAVDAATLTTEGWSVADLSFFLEIGMEPDGDFAGGSMAEIIEHGTAHLTPEDREAMAEYLMSP